MGISPDLAKGVKKGEDGDDRLSAVSALRMLYMKELKELQAAINNSLSLLQEHTANPQTDSALGKVGK